MMLSLYKIVVKLIVVTEDNDILLLYYYLLLYIGADEQFMCEMLIDFSLENY